MKTKTTIAAFFLAAGIYAQTKQSIAVLNIDTKGMINTSQEMGFLVRLELEKTAVYSVMDKYEVNDVISANKIDLNSCYSKTCLTETGKLLKVEKMLSGSVERFGEKIVISLRILDVGTGNVERQDATEYLNLPEVQKMIGISVQKLVGKQPDEAMMKLLIDYEVPVESPKNTLRLNGPRMGFAATVGPNYAILTGEDASKGEFGMFPATFQFGWQQEFQYISAGEFQALIENFFMFSGLESGRLIPSYSPLLGFRFKGGWEFGFGPNFRLIKKADGYYNDQGQWYLKGDDSGYKIDSASAKNPNPYQIQSRLDSRGDLTLSTGLVIAVGKTFRSGYLNIPVNVFVAPRKDGTTIGATFGFNLQKKRKVE